LQRIHRYTIDAHRKSIKPVSLEVYTEFLFDRHQLISHQPDDVLQLPAMDGQTQLQNTLGLLDGIAAPAAAWPGVAILCLAHRKESYSKT
jgi:ATP-dependent Lhr-like helicase